MPTTIKKRSGYKMMTDAEWKTIKAYQAAGLTQSQSEKITGRSWQVVRNIYTSNSFVDYQALTRAINAPKNNSMDKTKEMLNVKSKDMNEQEMFKKSLELSERQAKATENLAEATWALVKAWETQPNGKKKLF